MHLTLAPDKHPALLPSQLTTRGCDSFFAMLWQPVAQQRVL
jgi:hypothetical protein